MKTIKNFIIALRRGQSVREAWGDAIFINDLMKVSKIAKKIKESESN